MIKENKASLYLLYAIGEIVLVVIGILIALSINNWNGNRQNRELEHKALMDLRKEFEVNKLKVEFIHTRARENGEEMSKFLKYLKNTSFYQSAEFGLTELRENHYSPGGLKTYNPVSGVIKSLISSGQINMIRKDSLKYLLTSWSDLAEDFKENNELYLKWWNTSYANYMDNLPPLSEEYSVLIENEEWLLQEYVNAYSDYKYWRLIKTAEFQLYIKETAAKEILNHINRILGFIDEEISMKSR